eukprot:5095906-Prymnesium_polylepis.2
MPEVPRPRTRRPTRLPRREQRELELADATELLDDRALDRGLVDGLRRGKRQAHRTPRVPHSLLHRHGALVAYATSADARDGKAGKHWTGSGCARGHCIVDAQLRRCRRDLSRHRLWRRWH